MEEPSTASIADIGTQCRNVRFVPKEADISDVLRLYPFMSGKPGFFEGTEMPTAGWWEALWPDPAGVSEGKADIRWSQSACDTQAVALPGSPVCALSPSWHARTMTSLSPGSAGKIVLIC